MLKSFSAEIATVMRSPHGRRNVRVLSRFTAAFALMVVVYTVVFHLLMLNEGQYHSWITGFYWTLTVMSTLGFGDITFHTDLGRLFSIIVLLSGTLFMLVLLPFTFIQFFYQPWMAAQAAARAPRQLPESARDHVLLTNHDPVSATLIRRLEQYDLPYALLVDGIDEALRLHDRGLRVVVAEPDNLEAWRRLRVERASLVVCTASDVANTTAAFTVQELSTEVPIITTAADKASVDILELAGSSYVLRLEQMIGQSFARRTLGGDAMSHIIGRFDELYIAEANAHRTPMVGHTLREAKLREELGVTVVGVWERGRFEPATADTLIHKNTVLVMVGSREHLTNYDEMFAIYNVSAGHVVIIGGGRVGRATADALMGQGLDYRIVERDPAKVVDPEKYVVGSAADLTVLEAAGIHQASTVIITTHDDELNVYLTIYARRLHPDIQILVRATAEHAVATLHRAGADSVLSYASMGASAAMNYLKRGSVLLVAEGLDIFRTRIPGSMVGRTLAEARVRERTGCNVVALRTSGGAQITPDPFEPLPPEADIVLIGTEEAQQKFLQAFPSD
jgi:Trk K+ transport system NAD-binding subunit